MNRNDDSKIYKGHHNDDYYIKRSKIASDIIHDADLGNRCKYFENGLWSCDVCQNKTYLFLFELFQHLREMHSEDFPIEANSKLEMRLQECCENDPGIILERDMFLSVNGWSCVLCQNREKFQHKFQLVSHWYENHSNVNVTYEACQWCMELFSSPKRREQVLFWNFQKFISKL